MLYQLSYASTLKPTKNSRRGIRIARGSPKFPSMSVASSVEKHFPRSLLDNFYPHSFLYLSIMQCSWTEPKAVKHAR